MTGFYSAMLSGRAAIIPQRLFTRDKMAFSGAMSRKEYRGIPFGLAYNRSWLIDCTSKFNVTVAGPELVAKEERARRTAVQFKPWATSFETWTKELVDSWRNASISTPHVFTFGWCENSKAGFPDWPDPRLHAFDACFRFSAPLQQLGDFLILFMAQQVRMLPDIFLSY